MVPQPVPTMMLLRRPNKIPRMSILIILVLVCVLHPNTLILQVSAAVSRASSSRRQQLLQPGTHTSNHAVIVSSSRYWFNYRHANNALMVYEECRKRGIPDSNIILMIADEYVTNPRNPAKNGMYLNYGTRESLFSQNTQIDYRGDDVTVSNLLKVMHGISDTHNNSPVLQTDEHSNIFIYWTGHGGDQFFKFQDVEEITSHEISTMFQTMHEQKKYNEILFIADTCQAFTLMDDIVSPNIYAIGSSLRDQNSYAHHSDHYLGISVIEHYTFMSMQAIGINPSLEQSNAESILVNPHFAGSRSTIGKREVNCTRPMSTVPLSDFIGNIALKKPTVGKYKYDKDTELLTKMEGYYYGDNIGSSSIVGEDQKNTMETKNDNDQESLISNKTTNPQSSKDNSGDDYSNHRGMEPTDVRFLTCMVAFISAVLISSKLF